jgi:hypothetical protein
MKNVDYVVNWNLLWKLNIVLLGFLFVHRLGQEWENVYLMLLGLQQNKAYEMQA